VPGSVSACHGSGTADTCRHRGSTTERADLGLHDGNWRLHLVRSESGQGGCRAGFCSGGSIPGAPVIGASFLPGGDGDAGKKPSSPPLSSGAGGGCGRTGAPGCLGGPVCLGGGCCSAAGGSAALSTVRPLAISGSPIESVVASSSDCLSLGMTGEGDPPLACAIMTTVATERPHMSGPRRIISAQIGIILAVAAAASSVQDVSEQKAC
jgi:hypothetical protein